VKLDSVLGLRTYCSGFKSVLDASSLFACRILFAEINVSC